MKLLRDVAIRHLVTCNPDDALRASAKVMSERGVGCAVVIENEKVAGIVTERDILHSIAGGGDVDSVTVAEVMTKDVVSGSPGWDVLQAVDAMAKGGFRHLLVMEMNDPVGILSLRDLMNVMAEMAQGTDSAT